MQSLPNFVIILHYDLIPLVSARCPLCLVDKLLVSTHGGQFYSPKDTSAFHHPSPPQSVCQWYCPSWCKMAAEASYNTHSHITIFQCEKGWGHSHDLSAWKIFSPADFLLGPISHNWVAHRAWYQLLTKEHGITMIGWDQEEPTNWAHCCSKSEPSWASFSGRRRIMAAW